MGSEEPGRLFGGSITHGICEPCRRALFAQMGVPLRRFIDLLDVPVVVVGEDDDVRAANRLACELIGRDVSRIEGLKGGAVFECAYASLPGGCGNTVHCSGCAIRCSVTETFETGASLLRVPATLTQCAAGEECEIRLLISTEKAVDLVLLRIDEVAAGSPTRPAGPAGC